MFHTISCKIFELIILFCYLLIDCSYIQNAFRGGITNIEGELFPTSPWLVDSISCIYKLCERDGDLLLKLVQNVHDVDLRKSKKIKAACNFVEKEMNEVCLCN